MSRTGKAALIVQALLYIGAGINHLWHPSMYRAIMPSHYSHPAAWVAFTGIAEIAGGLGLLLPATRRFAAAGIVAMLVVYFDVHIGMLLHSAAFPQIPRWGLIARIPLQFVLIAWAAVFLRSPEVRTNR